MGVDPHGKKRRKRKRPAPPAGMDLPEQPEFDDERQSGKNLRTRRKTTCNLRNSQRAECPGDHFGPRQGPQTRWQRAGGFWRPAIFVWPIVTLLCNRKREEERQQSDNGFEQQQPRPAECAMRQPQRGFAEDFVIDPRVARGRPGIRICAREMADLEKFFSEQDVTPQVGVNGVVRQAKNGKTNDAEDERTAQRETGWRRRHGRKVAAAKCK